MANVVVEQIRKSFTSSDGKRRTDILRDVSLTVEDREIVSIIGPTGCGKSTLLRIIAGISTPDSGRVTIGGKAVLDSANPLSAMVFQSFNLFPWRTVLKNLEFGLEAKNLTASERRKIAMHYVELVGLKGFENYHPHELSGGMQQRVGLARALAIEQEVILLDEPFSSVDFITRESLQHEVLKILLETKKTAIFITHNIDEAIALSNRIISLGGRPATIKDVIDVNLPYPRTDELLFSEKTLSLKLKLKHTLIAADNEMQMRDKSEGGQYPQSPVED
jgi:NitT/TauT family transport system ATP-binding protein